ncbi:hypothetical protein FOC4_g10009589, partial [Fusarium odoratissimum]
ASFPPEVRERIWIRSLTRERILRILRERYRVKVRERIVMSKLFVTNHESRSAAKRFYRVHIPCTYAHMTCTYYGILYFNPEFDIIHIFEWWYFPELAHRIWKTYSTSRRHCQLGSAHRSGLLGQEKQ